MSELNNRLTKESKNSYFKNFFDENRKDSLKIWHGMKEIIKTKPTKNIATKVQNNNKKINTSENK